MKTDVESLEKTVKKLNTPISSISSNSRGVIHKYTTLLKCIYLYLRLNSCDERFIKILRDNEFI